MPGNLLLVLIIVAPFIVAAGALLLWERRKRGPPQRSELELLLTKNGFQPLTQYWVSREIHQPFRRGDDEIDCFSDGGSSDVAFRIKGHSLIVSHLSHAVLATLIRNNPQILSGEFHQLITAENEAATQAKTTRAQG